MPGKKCQEIKESWICIHGGGPKLLSFLLTAARTLNQLIVLSPCGQRSLIHGDCGAERKRRSGLVESQGSDPWRDSPSLLWVAPGSKEYKLKTPLWRGWGSIYRLLLVMHAKYPHLPHSGEWKSLILAHSNGTIRSTVVLERRKGLRHVALCYKHHLHHGFRHKHYQTRLKSSAAVTALR